MMQDGRHRLARLDKKLRRVPSPIGTGSMWGEELTIDD